MLETKPTSAAQGDNVALFDAVLPRASIEEQQANKSRTTAHHSDLMGRPGHSVAPPGAGTTKGSLKSLVPAEPEPRPALAPKGGLKPLEVALGLPLRFDAGYVRQAVKLWHQVVKVNHKTVEAAMAALGLQGRFGRLKLSTTPQDPEAMPAPALVGWPVHHKRQTRRCG